MPIQKKVTYRDLMEKAHRNDLILKNKVIMPLFAGLMTFYVITEATENRALPLIAPLGSLMWVIAEVKKTGRKLRECSASKDGYADQLSAEAKEYIDELGGTLNQTVTTLEFYLPGEIDESNKKNKKKGNSSFSPSGRNRAGGRKGGKSSDNVFSPFSPNRGNKNENRKPRQKETEVLGRERSETSSGSPLSMLQDLMGTSKPKTPRSVEEGNDLPVKKSQAADKPPIEKEEPEVVIPEIAKVEEPVKREDCKTLLKGKPILGDQEHLGVCGPTRTGKTQTAFNLLGSKRNVSYLSVKHTDRVPKHWEGVLLIDLEKDLKPALTAWEKEFDDYKRGNKSVERWWVIDEAPSIISSLNARGTKESRALAKRFNAFIVEVSSVGMAIGCRLCLLSQTPNAGTLGLDESILANFTWIIAGSEIKGFRHMAKFFNKLTKANLDAESKRIISSLTEGFHQLWIWKGQATLGSADLIPFEVKELREGREIFSKEKAHA